MNDIIPPLEAYLISKEFNRFLDSAKRYCTFIESQASKDSLTFLSLTRGHFLELYRQAIGLPDLGKFHGITLPDDESKSQQQRPEAFISSRLKESRYYWHQFDLSKESTSELVCGDLVDDLMDIYKDLKDCLWFYALDEPGAKESALFEFKSLFDIHWGDHCINALYAIHTFIQKVS